MEIRSFGVGRRIRVCERLLKERLAGSSKRLILLPIPTTRDGIYISGTDLAVSSLPSLFSAGATLAGYAVPTELRFEAERIGTRVLDVAEDESFQLENAKISANGALGYLLTNLTRDISELHLGIVGYGRIGKELLRLCLLLGASVTLFTTREAVALELCEAGVCSRVLDDKTDLSGLDILINTAPARLIDEARLDPKTDILDLASGSIFEPSARLTKLSSIPDSFYPETAGRLYAEAILRFLSEVEV